MAVHMQAPPRRVAAFRFENSEPVPKRSQRGSRSSKSNREKSKDVFTFEGKNAKSGKHSTKHTPTQNEKPPSSSDRYSPLEKSGKDIVTAEKRLTLNERVTCQNEKRSKSLTEWRTPNFAERSPIPSSLTKNVGPLPPSPLSPEGHVEYSDDDTATNLSRASAGDVADLYWLSKNQKSSSSAAIIFQQERVALQLAEKNFLVKRTLTAPTISRFQSAGSSLILQSKTEGMLEHIRKGFISKFLCTPRYCVFEPGSRRLFLWKNKRAMDSGSAKCLDRVVSARLLKLEELNIAIKHADGTSTTVFKAPSMEERNRWLKALQIFSQQQAEAKLHSSPSPSTLDHSRTSSRLESMSVPFPSHTLPESTSSDISFDECGLDSQAPPSHVQNIRRLFVSEHQRSHRLNTPKSRVRSSSYPTLPQK